MKRSSGLLALLASLAIVACSACGGTRTPAAAPESDPWAGYKGTYAPGGSGPEATASSADSKPTTTTTTAADSKSSRAEAKTASAPEPKPKAASKAAPSAPNDAKAMYGIASDTKTDELTPDATETKAPAKKTMKKRAGAIAGKKTVAKKAAKR